MVSNIYIGIRKIKGELRLTDLQDIFLNDIKRLTCSWTFQFGENICSTRLSVKIKPLTFIHQQPMLVKYLVGLIIPA
ncbi:unnamed protein product [Schistosoma bovis]|nr:unnamed protein product [Schistosoma bovis]